MSNTSKDEPLDGDRRTRRQVLTGAAGALGALALTSITKATPVAANSGDNFVLGTSNVAQGATTLDTSATPYVTALNVLASQATGVAGTSTFGVGVVGAGGGGFAGVLGTSGGIGVVGASSGNQDGVRGTSSSGNGVHGVSNDLNGVGIGVLGEQQGAAGTGVVGVGTVGVEGNSSVAGQSGVIGRGTYGVSAFPLSGGTGLFATNAFDGTGLALEAVGPAKFDAQILAARSGIASITYPNKAVAVTVGALSASSLVLATMQNTLAGISVVSAVPSTGTGKVTINLNKAPGSATRPLTAKVAWFVVN